MKCPKCRQGDLFLSPFNISKPIAMHEKCTNCNQDFEPEPGYYFGAMFISYIWTGWFCLFIVGIAMLIFGWSANQSIALLIGILVISYLWILRISRSMYIHLDVKYKRP
jgi:uncharacterized protein (DUF983 family)